MELSAVLQPRNNSGRTLLLSSSCVTASDGAHVCVCVAVIPDYLGSRNEHVSYAISAEHDKVIIRTRD